MTTSSQSKAYLQIGCPFSMRLRIFLAEAGLENEVEIVEVRRGSDIHRQLFTKVERAGLKPSFPIVEQAPDVFEVDSQAAIDRMSAEHGIDPATLSLLRFYNDGMMPRFGKMFMELRRLKGDGWDGTL